MKRIFRTLTGFVAALLTAYILGACLNSQFVIAGHGVPVSLCDRINMTVFDLSNMTLYLGVLSISLAIGFLIAGILKRFLPAFASIAYPLSGAVAIGVTLGLMYLQFQTIPISGARNLPGFVAQMIAGAIGGYVFSVSRGRKLYA